MIIYIFILLLLLFILTYPVTNPHTTTTNKDMSEIPAEVHCGNCLQSCTLQGISDICVAANKMRQENKGTYRAMIMNKLESAIVSVSPKNSVTLQFSEMIGESLIPYCRKCFRYLYSIASSTLDNWIQQVKTRKLHAEAAVRIIPCSTQDASLKDDARKDFAAFKNVYFAEKWNAEQVLRQQGDGIAEADILDYAFEHLQLMCLSANEHTLRLHKWFKDNFPLYGCYSPNSESRALQINSSNSTAILYADYKLYMEMIGEEVLSFPSFKVVWKRAWPHVTIRNTKDVSGKCTICTECIIFGRLLRSENDRRMLTMVRKHHSLLVKQSRYVLTVWREHAAKNYPKELFICCDGMAQDTCEVPHNSDAKPVHFSWPQHIEGIYGDGSGKMMVRSGNHIQGGADHTLSCLALQIQIDLANCISKGVAAPLELNLNFDGGETTYRTLVFMEFLVSQRIFFIVRLFRLPVGHTHNHLDQLFAEFKRLNKQFIFETPAQFENRFLKSLYNKINGESWKNNVNWRELTAAMDFEEYFEGCYSKAGQPGYISNWHKKYDGILYWECRQCVPSAEHPLGVQTSYKCNPVLDDDTTIPVVFGSLATSASASVASSQAAAILKGELLKCGGGGGGSAEGVGGEGALEQPTIAALGGIKLGFCDVLLHPLPGNFLKSLPGKGIKVKDFSSNAQTSWSFQNAFEALSKTRFEEADIQTSWEHMRDIMPPPPKHGQKTRGYEKGEAEEYVAEHPEMFRYFPLIFSRPDLVKMPSDDEVLYVSLREKEIAKRETFENVTGAKYKSIPTVTVAGKFDGRSNRDLLAAVIREDPVATMSVIELVQKLQADKVAMSKTIELQKKKIALVSNELKLCQRKLLILQQKLARREATDGEEAEEAEAEEDEETSLHVHVEGDDEEEEEAARDDEADVTTKKAPKKKKSRKKKVPGSSELDGDEESVSEESECAKKTRVVGGGGGGATKRARTSSSSSECDDDEENRSDEGIRDGDQSPQKQVLLATNKRLRLDELTPVPKSQAGGDEQRRAQDFCVGMRVRFDCRVSSHLAEYYPEFMETTQKSGGPTIINIHGIIRRVERRNFEIQWFGTQAKAKLYIFNASRIFACKRNEWDPEIERSFAAIL